LRADWNDCLNLGGGESTLVSFLHVWAADALAEIAAALGREHDAARYFSLARQLGETAEQATWDGGWYLRGFTAAGKPIGSNKDAEGKIFLEHMPWAVISSAAPPKRAREAMTAVRRLLASPYGTHLLWPSYTVVDDSIGYVTRVYPGVKENGSIFCHPNAWPIIAETMLGDGDSAWEYYLTMAPARFNDQAELRGAEPYVYAQFIYGRDHELYGTAQNPWLTGTAGWMYTAATQHILGLRPGFDQFTIDPCIPRVWTGFSVGRDWRGGRYEIVVTNPQGICAGVKRLAVDGVELEPVLDQTTGRKVGRLAPPAEGKTVRVEIEIG
jgi:N,N'-diacetylchitobiose phosphorylase